MTHVLLVMLSQLLPVDYTNHALVTFTPQSTLEAERVRSLGRFAGCCEPRGLGPQHRVLTQAELNLATQMGFSFEVTTQNVGQAIQRRRGETTLAALRIHKITRCEDNKNTKSTRKGWCVTLT